MDTIDILLKLNPRELLVPHYGVCNDAVGILELTKTKTERWMNEVRAFEKMGLSLDEIVERFLGEIADEAGIGREDLDAFTQRSVRVSVMGILTLFGKTTQPSKIPF